MTIKNLLAAAALFLASTNVQALDFGGSLGGILQHGAKALQKVGDTNCSANACGKGQPHTVNICLMQAHKILQNKNCANAYYKNYCKRGSLGNKQACNLIVQSGVIKGVNEPMANPQEMYSQPMRQPSRQPVYQGQDPMAPGEDMNNPQEFNSNPNSDFDQGFNQNQSYNQNQRFNNQRNMKPSVPQMNNDDGGLDASAFGG